MGHSVNTVFVRKSHYTFPLFQGTLLDTVDRRIETLLKDWHQNADMLFSIHPVDGSFLVWYVAFTAHFVVLSNLLTGECHGHYHKLFY